VNVEHDELRAAFERFLQAKRALRQAYRRFMAADPTELISVLERGASGQAGNDPATIEDIRELKDENETLRKSLTLLHAHSLRIQDQLDTLLGNADERLNAREAMVSRLTDGPHAHENSRSSVGPLDGAFCELRDELETDVWTTVTASAGMTG
jgi:hypothetical protein